MIVSFQSMINIKTLIAISFFVSSCIFTACERGGGRPEMDTGVSEQEQQSDQSDEQTESEAATVESSAPAEEAVAWNRFRGPNGVGISEDENIPVSWSDSENLAWKCELPGAGSSSPVLTKSFVFITSYSGYGIPGEVGGSADNLKRHLSCIQRTSGEILWTKTIDNEQREDAYHGMGVPEHGYATNTPVTDGEHVFVHYGKTGIVAYDLEGNEKWRKPIGTSSGNREWGSAASLMLHKDKLIVNAAEESLTIYALDKATGEVKWESPGNTLELCYSTPAIIRTADDREDIVIAVPGEVWGINPDNGKLTWLVETSLTGNLSPSINVSGANVYAFGGYRSSGSLSIEVDGKGDLTNSNVNWTGQSTSYVATPVLYEDRFYWIDDRGIYNCLDATSGELVHKERAPQVGGGRPVYASPVAIGGRIYIQSRLNGLLVVNPSDSMEVLEHNHFESDSSQFNATPAVDNGQLFLRSDRFLYCVSN